MTHQYPLHRSKLAPHSPLHGIQQASTRSGTALQALIDHASLSGQDALQEWDATECKAELPQRRSQSPHKASPKRGRKPCWNKRCTELPGYNYPGHDTTQELS